MSVVGDRWIIDNCVDTVAEKTWDLGLSLRSIQTGRLRQYVMFIVVGTIVLFVVASVVVDMRSPDKSSRRSRPSTLHSTALNS